MSLLNILHQFIDVVILDIYIDNFSFSSWEQIPGTKMK
jgi:hypothetical protein